MAAACTPYARPCVALVVNFFLVANSARLNIISQASPSDSRSLVGDLDAFNQNHRDDGGPPLEGCQANFFDTTCCCFVDAGILKQSSCECADSSSKCTTRIRASFHDKPSRTIKHVGAVGFSPRWWEPDSGYLKGYSAVEKEFCMAAPVVGPQVDSHERAFQCTCSTNMGATVEIPCGSGCNVENCKRSNPAGLDWAPFINGRGKCCLSSFTSTTKGCEQEVEPLTEAGAKTVLSDAVKHAARGEKTAFLVSAHLIDDMTKSFATAKQKKVSTSRSGAEFFFSGDYGYILKSIHRPEYDVLYQIVQPQTDGKRSLLEHVEWNRQRASAIEKVNNCHYIALEQLPTSSADASRLMKQIDYKYKNWWFDPELSIKLGTRTFKNAIGNLKAVWCEQVSQYRIRSNFRDSVGECADIEKDELYTTLHDFADSGGATKDAVLEVYSDLTKVFEVAPLSYQRKELKHFACWCEVKWWPSSLINDFVIAFEYKSSTWMVVKNSVTTIRQELERHQFTSFHKDYDMFDVKPFPIHSDQRALLYGMHFTKSPMRDWANWLSVRKNLWKDVQFMNSILDDPMVDYSLLVSAFYINDERMVLSHANLPNCVEERLDFISTGRPNIKDYGDATGSILVCFSIIDMLMEFTFSKTPENLLLFQKWSSWGDKMLDMFDCLGNVDKDGCGKYKSLRPQFRGVDIPTMMSPANPVAFVQDVTDMVNADGEIKVLVDDWATDVTYKCCCRAADGRCELAQLAANKSGWFSLGNPNGCGSLIGKDWHSYWRHAGHCRLASDEASRLRRGAVVLDGTTSWHL